MDAHYTINDTVTYDFCPASIVVGIDSYMMKGFDGVDRGWTSYTLTSQEAGPFARWWIVNVPGFGPHYYVAAESVPPHAVFEPSLSGLVMLDSSGDAALSSSRGALATFRADDGSFHAMEVFDGAERLLFVGKPFQP